MAFESWFDPHVVNGSNAVGLIQFTKVSEEDAGASIEELLSMNAITQLDHVKTFLSNKNLEGKGLGDLYMAVLWPKGIGLEDDEVLWKKGEKYYNSNAGLDVNRDGMVTKGEALQKVIDRRNTFNTVN